MTVWYCIFLKRVACRSVLNRSVGFAQLLGRGDTLQGTDVLLYYAQTLGDFEQALGQLMGEGKLSEAIAILDDANIEKGIIYVMVLIYFPSTIISRVYTRFFYIFCYTVETLVYKWSPLLIVKEPVSTVNMWLDKPSLKPAFLLPSLLRYCAEWDRAQGASGGASSLHQGENVAVKYLRQHFDRVQQLAAQEESKFPLTESTVGSLVNLVVRSPADASLYQTYLWILAKYDQPNEAQLISALKAEVDIVSAPLPLSSEMKNKFIDFDFVLRQCQTHGRKKSQVYVYLFLGLADEALQLALSLDIALAKVSVLVITLRTYMNSSERI